MQTFPLERIVDISREYVKYLDNDNLEKQFSLVECNDNWVTYCNKNIDHFINWDGSPAQEINLDDNHCVGQRDWFADKPFFEFFTYEKIRFEISPKKRFIDMFRRYWKQRYYKEFHNISIKLEHAGWFTFDLS